MKIEIINKNKYETSSWSGGTTTQLMIYPNDAKYHDRNFKWRLSSARIEAEESVFTLLPGISRIIMIIDGMLTLAHEGKNKVALRPFDQHSFMGDWTTKSFGRASDFNLMLNVGCSGELSALTIEERGTLNMMLGSAKGSYENVTNVFYAVDGDLDLFIQDIAYSAGTGDIISITRTNREMEIPVRIGLFNKSSRKINAIGAAVYY